MTILKVQDPFFTSTRNCQIHVKCYTDDNKPVNSGKIQCRFNKYYLATNWVKNGEAELNFQLPEDVTEGIHTLMFIYGGSTQAEYAIKSNVLLFNTKLNQKLDIDFVMDDYMVDRNEKITLAVNADTRVKRLNPNEFTILDTKSKSKKPLLDENGLHSGLNKYIIWNKTKTTKTCKFKIELLFTENNSFEVGLGQFNSSGEFIIKAEHSINKNNVSRVNIKNKQNVVGLIPSVNDIVRYEFEIINNNCTLRIIENEKTNEYSNLGKLDNGCMFFIRKWTDGEIIIKNILYQDNNHEIIFNSDESDGINMDVHGKSVIKFNGKSLAHPPIVDGKSEYEFVVNMVTNAHPILWILNTNYGLYATSCVINFKPGKSYLSTEYFENKGMTDKIRKILKE